MSAFELNMDNVHADLLEDLLKKYDAVDIDVDTPPEDHIHADRILYVIEKVNQEVYGLMEQMEKSVDFYKSQIEKKKKSIGYLESNIKTFLERSGKKTIQLPNGTLRNRNIKKYTFPTDHDGELIKWSTERNIGHRLTVKPDKTKIKQYIEKTGEIPEGVEIEEVVSFSYKTSGGTK